MAVYFRVDKRPFMAGNAIRTAGEFTDRHPDVGKQAEQILSERRPRNKPERSTCLMLFVDEECARNFCCMMDGGRLYTVDFREDQILHIGDMSLVDQIAKSIRDDIGPIEELVDAYWNSETYDPSCIEILVEKGLVVTELKFSRREKNRRFMKLVGIPDTSPEATEDFWPIEE